MQPPLERTRARASRNRRFSAATNTRIFSVGVLRASARAVFAARRRESGAEPFERAVSLTMVSVIETPPLFPRCFHRRGNVKALLIYNVARKFPSPSGEEGDGVWPGCVKYGRKEKSRCQNWHPCGRCC